LLFVLVSKYSGDKINVVHMAWVVEIDVHTGFWWGNVMARDHIGRHTYLLHGAESFLRS